MTRCSILIPAYNNTEEQKLELLESINKQTAINQIQVIIVDDGSEDLFKWEATFLQSKLQCPSTLYHFPYNKGVGAARKFLFEQLNTEYFLTMDSDDLLATETIVEDYITYLDNNQNYDYVTSWIQCIYGHLKGEISTNANCFHGCCGRTSSLRRYNLNCIEVYYHEDGTFFNAAYVYGLTHYIIPKIGYIRGKGYLTNDVCWPIADLNIINDKYTALRHLSLLSINTKEEYERWFARILLIFRNLDTDIQEFIEHEKYDPIKYYIEIYYYISCIQLFPTDILQKIYQILNNESSTRLRYYINEVLLKTTNFYCAAIDDILTYQDIELKYIAWLNNFANNFHPTEYDTLPPQILKNFPWCYKTLKWNSKHSLIENSKKL